MDKQAGFLESEFERAVNARSAADDTVVPLAGALRNLLRLKSRLHFFKQVTPWRVLDR